MASFHEQLENYARMDDADGRAEAERRIWAKFGVERAVFILDMAGFTHRSERKGIVHYLSLVQRMRLTLAPLVAHGAGQVVKFEADNCFALFPDTRQAVETAITYNRTLAAMNLMTPDDLDIHASVGIDFGEILLVEDSDLWGGAVNFACKLGEDIADPGEILVTKRAMDRVPAAAGLEGEPLNLTVAGVELDVRRITYR